MVDQHWRWRVIGPSEPAAALDFGWFAPLARHRHQPYLRPRGDRDGGPLALTLHTDGLTSFVAEDHTDPLSVLLYFILRRQDLLRAARSQTRFRWSLPDPFSKVDPIIFGDVREEQFGPWRLVKLGGALASIPYRQIDDAVLAHVLGPSATDSERRDLRYAWEDLEAHEAFDGDIFVTDQVSLLKHRAEIGSDRGVWILSVGEVLDYFEITAKGEGHYFFNPVVRTNRWTYYCERVKESAPGLNRVWRAAAAPAWRHDAKEDRLGYLQSAETRIRYLMEARDRIGYWYYTSAGIDANDAVLYHLNYFFLLATGVFDNLAWILNHLYKLRLDKFEVDLRQSKFRTSLPERVAELISPRAKLMNIFYETRHSVAHRLLVWGIGFAERDGRNGTNLAEIDADLAGAISNFDTGAPNSPYTKWGLAHTSGAIVLEPYRFATAGLQGILRLTEDLFQLVAEDTTMGWEAGTGEEGAMNSRRTFAVPLLGVIA